MPEVLEKSSRVSRKVLNTETATSATLPLTYVGKMTQQQLEKNLWDAADILRGKIDSGDFKHYIFGLLFFKRLCDVWQEEYEERLKLYEDEELAADPEEHRFHIPPGAFWDDVRSHSTNIGERLNIAFRAIEDANTRLRGVFQDVDFNNKERFPDATLELLLQHFSQHRLRKCDVEADILGAAYEYLIAKFADDAGKKDGEFYTPKMVTRLIVECLQPEEGMSIYDPTCGSGGMLLEMVNHLKRQGKNPKSLQLYACVLIINRSKQAARREKVLFVNGAEEMVEGKNQNTLSKDNVERLANAFVAFEDEERFVRVVELEEIKKNDFNLNIARYVQTAEEEEQIDVAAEVMVLKELLEKRDKAESKMLGFLKELGYE